MIKQYTFNQMLKKLNMTESELNNILLDYMLEAEYNSIELEVNGIKFYYYISYGKNNMDLIEYFVIK